MPTILPRLRPPRLFTLCFFLLLSAFVAGAVLFAVWKLRGFGYNALDLAIYRQTVEATARGDWFRLTIHPHPYLGDHFELLVPLFAPALLVAPGALTLLLFQVAGAALALWPLYLLCRTALPRWWAFAVCAAFAFHPLVHALLAFEFHGLVFALPLLLAAIVAYERKRFSLWILWSMLALLIREDMGLVLVGWGVLALWERRPARWIMTPMVLGGLWLLLGMAVTQLINHEQYKFLAYYGWLGSTAAEAAQQVLAQPWTVVLHLVQPQNLLFLAVLALLFAGLPLLRLRRLVPVALYGLALLLTSFGGSDVTLRSHYMAVLLPFLFWAAVGALADIRRQSHRLLHAAGAPPVLALMIFGAITLYGFFTYSPLRPTTLASVRQQANAPLASAQRALVAAISPENAVAASYATLASLAGRPELYSLHYGFQGHRQLSSTPYAIPPVQEVLLDGRDALFYAAQYKDQALYATGDDRLRALISDNHLRLARMVDSLLLFSATGGEDLPLVQFGNAPSRTMSQPQTGHVRLLGSDQLNAELSVVHERLMTKDAALLPLALTWQRSGDVQRPISMVLQYMDNRGTIRGQEQYPLAYGLYPPEEWPLAEPVTVFYRFLIPNLPAGTYTVRILLQSVDGYLGLDEKLSAAVIPKQTMPLGDPLVLGMITLE